MDVVAGKNGSFFVVKREVDAWTAAKLAEISFDEFCRYNAWSTMKKISKLNGQQYAAQNSLQFYTLENFERIAADVDFKATQDLVFFIETEVGREQLEDEFEIRIINSGNFKNAFAYPAPKEVAGVLTDPVVLRDKDIPPLLKKTGISIKRSVLSNFVKWNSVMYRVDISPATSEIKKISAHGSEIMIGEYCYIFNSDDWNYIKRIDNELNRRMKAKKSWFVREKTPNEIFVEVIRKFCKDRKSQIMYSCLYKTYAELRDTHADYRSVMVHEYHHLKNRILLENRCLKPNSKALLAADCYYILVEDERSAHLAVTLDRIDRYWHDHDWDALARKEQCFAVLASRSEAERNRLLSNLDFVVNTKLKYWTDYNLDAHYEKLVQRLQWLLRFSSVAKGLDELRKEYVLMRSMLYSFRVYNPYTGKYKFVKLDKYIKIDIPVTGRVLANIIGKTQMFLDRKIGARNMLKIKYGIGDRLIRKAANVYDNNLRIKQVKN